MVKRLDIESIRSAILQELHSTSCIPKNCEATGSQLQELLLNTIDRGEGNSVILVGPRGSGKSALTNQTLSMAKKVCKNPFIMVYLNGFVCVDDQQALKEIAKQLCPKEELSEVNLGSFASTMTFLLETLNSGDKERQSVVFILDEFDLFTQHHNQHLLYNLFDLSQSKSTPLAVIGLTCRQDIMELMEKRVKSRFSHRQFFLYGPTSIDQYIEIATDILSPNTISSTEWKSHVSKVFSSPSNKIRTYLERIYNYNRSIQTLKNCLTWAVVELTADKPKLNEELLEEKLIEFFKDNKATMIRSLSKLECCLLISIARLSTKYANQPFNLEMALHEYNEFVTFEGGKMAAIPNQSLAVTALEKLVSCQLVRVLSSRQSKVQRSYKLMYLNIDLVDFMTIVKTCNLPANVQKWAQSTLNF